MQWRERKNIGNKDLTPLGACKKSLLIGSIMKKQLLELLICPSCLPSEFELHAEISAEENNDIETATLWCPTCEAQYIIRDGIAFLVPGTEMQDEAENKYETKEVVSSYLWSHYGELLNDSNSSTAYTVWFEQMLPHGGVALDAGGAVGRFTFEMSRKCDFAICIDNSKAFIQTARKLMKNRRLTFELKEEGFLTKEATINIPDQCLGEKVEFIVGDALALPIRKKTISSFSSLNLIDKVASPMHHLEEMNRVMKDSDVQFLLSDPFSWSKEAADVDEWLGGKIDGKFSGRGLDNIKKLLRNSAKLAPGWQVDDSGKVWWKIRTHSNHYELIQSCFVKASR